MQSIWPSTSSANSTRANRRFGLVKIEEHLPLGIERRLRRIDVLRPGLLARLERSRRERDHAPAFIANGKHDALAKSIVDRPLRAVALLLRTEESTCAERLLIRHPAQFFPQRAKAVGRISNPEFPDALIRKPAAGKVFARQRTLRPAQLLLKPRRGGLVQIEKLGAHSCLGRLLWRRELALGQRNAALLRNNAHGFRKSHVLDLAYEGENVTRNTAPEAMKELPHRMHAERRRLLLVERAQPRVILSSSFAQADVAFDHLDDVGLLLHGLGKILHGRFFDGFIHEHKARKVLNLCGSSGSPSNFSARHAHLIDSARCLYTRSHPPRQ